MTFKTIGVLACFSILLSCGSEHSLVKKVIGEDEREPI